MWLHKLRHLRESYGLSVHDLSILSDISKGAIYRIESGTSPYKTNDGVAMALADALDVQIADIFDSIELSHLGRPAHTGKPIAALRLINEHEVLCEGCNLIYPRAVGCTDCKDHQVA